MEYDRSIVSIKVNLRIPSVLCELLVSLNLSAKIRYSKYIKISAH